MTTSIHSLTRTAAGLLVVPLTVLAHVGSLPGRWTEALSEAIDGPWDLNDPFLTCDGEAA